MTALRWARPADQPAIRAFLEAVGFVARPPETWAALGMSAATAWQGERLLGAIPLEPRPLKVGSARRLRCLQQTTVAVDPAWRGRGLGSALQAFITERLEDPAELASVYREQPDSAGYRWYLANGFRPLQRLRVWSRQPGGAEARGSLRVAAWDDEAVPLAAIEALRCRLSEAGSGLYIPREARPLGGWLPVHPYGRARRFEIAWSERPFGYALLGRDGAGNLELLESGQADPDAEAAKELIAALCGLATARQARLRCMLAESDGASVEAVRAAGFARDSSMDLLVKPLRPGATIDVAEAERVRWRHHAIDYV